MFNIRNILVKSAISLNGFTQKSQNLVMMVPCCLSRNYNSTNFLFKKSLNLNNFDIKRLIHLNISQKQIKKRLVKKKWSSTTEECEGLFDVTAFSTAEEYDLESILEGVKHQQLYIPKKFFSTDNLGAEQDVLYVTAKYPVGSETRDIFFFREGCVVLWNCDELECTNVLGFLKNFERERYRNSLVKGESEIMSYKYLPENKSAQFSNGIFHLTKGEDNFLEKYTFSNALATSIKLGIWEATLDQCSESMEFLTMDMKRGTQIRISRQDLLRKTGELFALRHLINLSSDLLDTPDFYWDREELEALYLQICAYFSITRRTKVMNEKINHCIELADLVSSHLNDNHHVRLEWMIIILIMVEVGFEILHYIDRFYSKNDGHIKEPILLSRNE